MKHIILILILLLGGLAARAENMVSVSSTSGHPQDEVTLQVSFANNDAAVAFQVEIPLGSQLTYVAGSVDLNPDRVTDHQVSAAVVNGSLRIYAFSLSLIPFVGNEGDLLSFTLKLKNEPGDYALELNETKLSDAAGNALPVTTSNGMVTILSPKLQINTPSMDFGHVPIRSEYTKIATVKNIGNEPLVITGIAFSDAVFSCSNFTETTVQPNSSKSFTFKFAPIFKGAVTATATIVSNSIAGNGIINLVADPFAVNEIHIDYVTGYCDSVVEVPISMNNMEAIMGFQIDMNLPQALEYVDFTLSNRKADHVSVGVFNEGLLRLMAYSASGSAFTGEDGVIGTLKLRLRGLYGNYYLNPSKAVLADANGEDALSAKYQGRVTIRSPKINGNNSLSFGSSPVTETVTREYVVRNQGNASMRIDQVVFDQSDFSVAETMPIVVEQYANTTLHVSYSREQKGDFSALMKIYSNDPQNGLKNVALSGSRYEPNDLELTVDPFSLENGDLAVSLVMNNYSGIVALQANFHYPYEDYSVQSSDFQLTERFANHYLYAMPINDSTFRILILSMQNNAVEGHEGVVLNVTLHHVGPLTDEEYKVAVSDIVLSGREGTNLFTGTMDPLEFDFFAVPMDFHFSFNGSWSESYKWQYRTLPRSRDRVFIDANCQLDMNAEVADLSITNGMSLTLQPGNTLTVTGDISNTSATGLIIEDGAQLMHASDNVSATVKKNIVGHGPSKGKYYLISNPLVSVVNPELASVYHLTRGNFDLYDWLAGSADSLEWRNFKDFSFMMHPEGYGYLYANQGGVELLFPGVIRRSDIGFGKSVSCVDDEIFHFNGWNLIGNPFVCDAYLVTKDKEPLPFYRINAAGNDFEADTLGVIAPMESVFYIASENDTVYFVRADYSSQMPYTITVSAAPADGGTVNGGGIYTEGQTCMVIAIANEGYVFSNWMENDSVVSTQANYQFIVDGNRTLVANFTFVLPTYTINVSANPTEGGTVSGGGSYQVGQSCTLTATANEGYTFTNWTENGELVSTNATYSFTVTENRSLVANFIASAPIGAINGKFSINSNGDQVYFSQGNLQYIGSASTPYWKFADNQWDVLGTTTGQNSGDQNVDRDLFGWGTSGYNHGANCYQPWSTSTSNSYYLVYGSDTYNLYDQTGQADWGYNPISNGGNQSNQWRTLTRSEWNYVFYTRTTTSRIRYAKAQVAGVNGIILLPDDWNTSTYSLSNTNTSGASFSSNTISASQWTTLQNAGAVFLPAAGGRYGTSVDNAGVVGNGSYWSASRSGTRDANHLHFFGTDLYTDYTYRSDGLSVRLVAPAEN